MLKKKYTLHKSTPKLLQVKNKKLDVFPVSGHEQNQRPPYRCKVEACDRFLKHLNTASYIY